MNDAHLHLMVNHVSLFFVSIGLAGFVWAWVRKSSDMRLASIALFILAGIFSWVATQTGGWAADLVEKLPGINVELTKSLIGEHAAAAEYAHNFTVCTGVAAFVLLLLDRFKPQFSKWVQILIVILATFSSMTMARTAYLGGHIGHSEIRTK